MAPRMPGVSRRAYSDALLRPETAAVISEGFQGIRKMVAAALVVSVSRIDRMCEGLDANMLELLTRSLERVRFEEGDARVANVLRWLCNRFGRELADIKPGDDVERSLAQDLACAFREDGESAAATVALFDGATAEEINKAERETVETIEAWQRVLATIREQRVRLDKGRGVRVLDA